ncbi:MAG: hypothetical protein ACTSPI_14350 [Candidatus Heimdallarchaeaceae archaeon]
MAIEEINSSTFTADIVNFIRSKLNDNIIDPLGSRASNERFVMTSYPQRPVRYPIITVTDLGIKQESRLGMQSESTLMRLGVEIRVWARNIKERDEMFDEVYTWLRTNQFGGSDATVDANIHDFSMTSVTNVSEPDVKSKIMECSYLFVCE